MTAFYHKPLAEARARCARLWASTARFRKDRGGATVVEFALVIGPFFAMLFGIMQTSIVIFANQALQTMTSTASRQIMTGEITGSGIEAFRNAICGGQGAALMFKCSDIRIQVKSYESFVGLDPKLKTDACFKPIAPPPAPQPTCWEPGGARSIVLVRVQYDWPFGFDLETLKAKHTLVALTAFRSEPY